jgi:hypothetical protein
MVNNFFYNCVVYEIMWKNTVEPDRLQMTIWRMCIACWIIKATNTHSEYVARIAFPRQQRLHERTPMLRYIVHYLPCYVATLSKIRRRGNTFTKKINAYFHDNQCICDIKNTWLHVKALFNL